MSNFEIIVGGLFGIGLLYIIVRLLFSAIFTSYFETKNQFEKGERNGKKRPKEE